MRYHEFKLNEIKMSPKSLLKDTSSIPAICGVEYEMYVSDVDGYTSEKEPEPDYDYNPYAVNIESIIDFFHSDYTDRSSLVDLDNQLKEEYQEWLMEQAKEEYDKHDPDEQESFSRFSKEFYDDNYDNMQEEWLESKDIYRMSDVEKEYDVTWPNWTDYEQSDPFEALANSLHDAIRRGDRIISANSYHAARRSDTQYSLETDTSLDEPNSNSDIGIELISPPLPFEETIRDMDKILRWMDKNDGYTNNTCGLHMNISVQGVDHSKLDYIKLVLFVGDPYLVELFDREASGYADSVLPKIVNTAYPQDVITVLDNMKSQLSKVASHLIHSGKTKHTDGIDNRGNYIEFRYPGNDWASMNLSDIENTLRRFILAYTVACDPEKYKKEYAKKLYKSFHTNKNNSVVFSHFADYSAGNLSQEEFSNHLVKLQAHLQGKQSYRKDGIKPSTKYLKKFQVIFNPKTKDVNLSRTLSITDRFDKLLTVNVSALDASAAIEKARDQLQLSKYDRNDSIQIPDFYFKAREVS